MLPRTYLAILLAASACAAPKPPAIPRARATLLPDVVDPAGCDARQQVAEGARCAELEVSWAFLARERRCERVDAERSRVRARDAALQAHGLTLIQRPILTATEARALHADDHERLVPLLSHSNCTERTMQPRVVLARDHVGRLVALHLVPRVEVKNYEICGSDQCSYMCGGAEPFDQAWFALLVPGEVVSRTLEVPFEFSQVEVTYEDGGSEECPPPQ